MRCRQNACCMGRSNGLYRPPHACSMQPCACWHQPTGAMARGMWMQMVAVPAPCLLLLMHASSASNASTGTWCFPGAMDTPGLLRSVVAWLESRVLAQRSFARAAPTSSRCGVAGGRPHGHVHMRRPAGTVQYSHHFCWWVRGWVRTGLHHLKGLLAAWGVSCTLQAAVLWAGLLCSAGAGG